MKSVSKNKISIFIGLVIVVAIVGFMFFLSQTSDIGKAIEEVKQCTNQDQVKNVFDKYKGTLTTINGNNENEIEPNFLKEIRDKLYSFNLNDNEISVCKGWLPPAPTSLNLIIVPDLSRRIIDGVNNPDQISNDTTILNYIWEAFENSTKLKMNTKDRLTVDVTDKGQAGGQFLKLANNLIFDLSKYKDKINRLYFTDSVRNQYTKNIDTMYQLAKREPIGADYWHYFRYDVSKHIPKPTLYDNYRNVLIIITDGYLEAENSKATGNPPLYTGSLAERQKVANKMKSGKSVEGAVDGIIKIPDIDQKFPTLEVLLLEINPRASGTPKDYDILEFLWRDWFKRIGIKNADDNFFIQRNDATLQTKDIIDNFLNDKK